MNIPKDKIGVIRNTRTEWRCQGSKKKHVTWSVWAFGHFICERDSFAEAYDIQSRIRKAFSNYIHSKSHNKS